MDGYITIAEAATRANITPQAIYKRLNSTLKPYVKTVKNRKYIHIKALEILNSTTVDNESTNFKQEVVNVEIMDIFNKTIELLNKQLEVKDKQIETKDLLIMELNNRLDQALKNASQSNFIAAQEKQKMLDDPGEEKRSFFQRLFNRTR